MFGTSNRRSLLRGAGGFVGLAGLEWRGWAGTTPWFVVIGLGAALSVLLHEPVNRAVARRLDGPRHLAIGLHMFCVVAVIYAMGWGSTLALAGLAVVTVDMRIFGGRIWRPAVVWGVAWLVVGECLVSWGVVFSYLDANDRFLMDGVVGITLVNLVGVLGRSAERRDREAEARAVAEESVAERQRRLDTLLGSSFELIALIRDDGTIGYVSPSLEEQIRPGARAIADKPLDQLIRHGNVVHPDDIEPTLKGVLVAMRQRQSRFELRIRDWQRPELEWRWWEAVVTDLRDHPAVRGLVANLRDVSVRKSEQVRLAQAALTDALTGLPNRAAFLQRLDAAMRPGAPGAAGRSVAVLFIDLDGFKAVNDRLGHDWGDRLLVQVADRLVGAVRAGEVVARWAGDEFVVLAEEVTSPVEATAVASRLSKALGECGWRVEDGDDVVVSGSVGVAMAQPGTMSGAELISHADKAMYSIKSDRRPDRWGGRAEVAGRR